MPKTQKTLTNDQLKALRFSNWRKEFMAAQIRRDSANRAVRMATAADLGAEADKLLARVLDDFDREFGP